jgi:hypothetical protein
MSQEYTIDWASPASDPWDNGHGSTNVTYTIKLASDQAKRNVRVNQRPETPAPFVGQQLYGDVVQKEGKNGPYFKFEKKQRPDAPSSGGQRQNNSSKGKDESYKADRSKLRMEAMRSAINQAREALPGSIATEGIHGLDALITHFYSLMVGAMLDDSDEKVMESDKRLDQLAQGSQL